MSALIRPREDDYEDDDGYRPSDPLDLVMPASRAIDLPMSAPDPADARRPLSARTDIGDPPRSPTLAPTLAPAFAPPPMPTAGRLEVSPGQTLPPLDQLFAAAGRAPAPPSFPASPAPASTEAGLLDPASLFKGLSRARATPQVPATAPPQAAAPLNAVQADPLQQPARAPDPFAVFQAPPVWPQVTMPSPPPPPQPSPHFEATPDLRRESFPPDLPDLRDSPFFAQPPVPASFAPPAEPPVAEALEAPLPEPEPIPEPVNHWSPPPQRPADPVAPPPADLTLEDMLARLERGMQKRRQALAVRSAEVPTEAGHRPLPDRAAAPEPLKEAPPPPMMAPPMMAPKMMAIVPPVAPAPMEPWTPPATQAPAPSLSPAPPTSGDGLLDQPLHVALGVLRNLVRG